MRRYNVKITIQRQKYNIIFDSQYYKTKNLQKKLEDVLP